MRSSPLAAVAAVLILLLLPGAPASAVAPAPALATHDALEVAAGILAERWGADAALAEGFHVESSNIATARAALAPAPGQAADARALDIADLGLRARQDLVGSRLAPSMGPLLAKQLDKTQTVRAVLEVLAGTQGAPLARAIDVAAEATGASRSAAPAAGPTSLMAAVEALAQRHGHALVTEERARLASLEGTALADGLAGIVDAFAAYEATAGAPLEVHGAARLRLLDAMRDLGAGAPFTSASAECLPIEVPADPSGPAVLALELAGCPTTYTRDVLLQVDVGGDDVYWNNAGGSGYGPPDPCIETNAHPAAALLDMAGDDVYGDDRGCGVNGGGLGGSGLLVDVAGNDHYSGRGLGVNGGAHAGRGLLIDAAGDDAYVATERWGTNGGGFLGNGALIDVAGDDRYVAAGEANNGGAEKGTGLLIDGGGRDLYAGGDRATNGGAQVGSALLLDAGVDDDAYTTVDGVWGWSVAKNGGGGNGGAGALVDQGGDDRYEGGDSGANGGGWYGVGLLVDGAGNDTFVAGEDGVNGAGWALLPISRNHPLSRPESEALPVGVGFLVDGGGHDTYLSRKFGTNGGCYVGAGFLVDVAGNDRYVAEDGGGVNGGAGGKTFGLCSSFLVDGAGDDLYETRFGGRVFTNDPRTSQFEGGHGANGGAGGVGGVAFLLDAAGNDVYTAFDRGVNGGAAVGVALLVDGGGDDRYVGGDGATNGGGSAGLGLLLDLGGRDSYAEGGAAPTADADVVPKGTAGAQMDL